MLLLLFPLDNPRNSLASSENLEFGVISDAKSDDNLYLLWLILSILGIYFVENELFAEKSKCKGAFFNSSWAKFLYSRLRGFSVGTPSLSPRIDERISVLYWGVENYVPISFL